MIKLYKKILFLMCALFVSGYAGGVDRFGLHRFAKVPLFKKRVIMGCLAAGGTAALYVLRKWYKAHLDKLYKEKRRIKIRSQATRDFLKKTISDIQATLLGKKEFIGDLQEPRVIDSFMKDLSSFLENRLFTVDAALEKKRERGKKSKKKDHGVFLQRDDEEMNKKKELTLSSFSFLNPLKNTFLKSTKKEINSLKYPPLAKNLQNKISFSRRKAVPSREDLWILDGRESYNASEEMVDASVQRLVLAYLFYIKHTILASFSQEDFADIEDFFKSKRAALPHSLIVKYGFAARKWLHKILLENFLENSVYTLQIEESKNRKKIAAKINVNVMCEISLSTLEEKEEAFLNFFLLRSALGDGHKKYTLLNLYRLMGLLKFLEKSSHVELNEWAAEVFKFVTSADRKAKLDTNDQLAGQGSELFYNKEIRAYYFLLCKGLQIVKILPFSYKEGDFFDPAKFKELYDTWTMFEKWEKNPFLQANAYNKALKVFTEGELQRILFKENPSEKDYRRVKYILLSYMNAITPFILGVQSLKNYT